MYLLMFKCLLILRTRKGKANHALKHYTMLKQHAMKPTICI